MKPHTHGFQNSQTVRRVLLNATQLVLAGSVILAGNIQAADAVPAAYDPAFVQQMLKRLDAQEAELKSLREQLKKEASSAEAAAASEAAKKDAFPRVSFHGFGDLNYGITDTKKGENSFAVGELDLFIDSRISDNLRIISENVLGADDTTQEFGFEIERLILQWHQSDYLTLDMGRYHTGIGYYNTAYHHGTWFQNAVGRPGYLSFEDDGGLIPAHSVGISASGEIPSGSLGLTYVAEIGNGRAFKESTFDGTNVVSTGNAPVLNVGDNNLYKAFNVAFKIKPEWAPGLEMGAGVYHDTVTPLEVPRTDEVLAHGFVVYKNAKWEFLNEAEFWRHKTHGEAAHLSHAFFNQVSRKFGVFTPYARFTYRSASGTDPLWKAIGQSGLQYGPSVGVRWDFSQFAAFKVQYDDRIQKGQDDLQQVTFQVAFTF